MYIIYDKVKKEKKIDAEDRPVFLRTWFLNPSTDEIDTKQFIYVDEYLHLAISLNSIEPSQKLVMISAVLNGLLNNNQLLCIGNLSQCPKIDPPPTVDYEETLGCFSQLELVGIPNMCNTPSNPSQEFVNENGIN